MPTLILPHFSAPASIKFDFENTALLNCLHSGGFSLSDRRRRLDTFLEIFLPLQTQNSALHLHITGPLSQAEKNLIASHVDGITHHGSVSLETSVAMQVAADALLLITPEDSEALPGKFSEYSLAERPVYYLGSGNWLKLVNDKSALYPLQTQLIHLQKNARACSATVLRADDAAEYVSSFLKKVARQTNI